jgi:CopG family nickel-responsive transcriptional regulator
MTVSRFSVSLESELLEALDEYVRVNKFPNRSRAVRQLIERNSVEHKWQCGHVVAGAIILLYPRHRRDLTGKVITLEQEYHDELLSVQRLPLSPLLTLDILAVKGRAQRLTEFADKLITLKGIQHGKLVMTRTGEETRER